MTTPTTIILPSDQDASGRTFDELEVELVRQALESGVLTSTKGSFTRALETRFGELLGIPHVSACASGSAAVHIAIAALDPEPGDEIVTTSVTDMGALAPILYQGAIPVFADVDPVTGNVTAASIEAALSARTRAIIVTHLFGNPCDMEAIGALAERRRLPIIEDCAQAYLATSRGRPVGTVGAIGCFSLQQGKHITTGEGGLVVTGDPALARRIRLLVNKAWPYGEPNPDHEFIALNYRLSELQAAVAVGQLTKLVDVVESRRRAAAEMTGAIKGLRGITLPEASRGDQHSWWKYPLIVDTAMIDGGPQAIAAELKVGGIASAPRYIQKPAFRCRIFTEQNTFGSSHWPFTLARPEALDYSEARFSGTFRYLEQVLVLPWNERYTGEHTRYLAEAITASVERLDTTR